ncbi:Ig-like domain-containing protein, partial [Streptococcus taonis]
MCFNRKNAEQKNWRMIKKGKHFLFGCSLVFAVGATLATPTVHADSVEAKTEATNSATQNEPTAEATTYAAPAATSPVATEAVEANSATTAVSVDKTQLEALLAQAKAKNLDGQEASVKDEVEAAIAEAEALVANGSASQDQINQSVERLTQAVASVKEVTEVAAETTAESSETPKVRSRRAVEGSVRSVDENNLQRAIVTKENFESFFQEGGTASYDKSSGTIKLTEDVSGQAGNAYLRFKIDPNQDFSFTGKVDIGNKYEGHTVDGRPGGDGVGFTFHTGNANKLGQSGASVGMGGINAAFGFKLDSWHNTSNPDAKQNSIADPKYGGRAWGSNAFGAFYSSNNAGKVNNISDAKALTPAPNGDWVDFKINYNGTTKEFTVTYGNQTWTTKIDRTSRSMTNEAKNALTARNATYALSFVGSTGSGTNLQRVQIEKFEFTAPQIVHMKFVDAKGNEIEASSAIPGDENEVINLSTQNNKIAAVEAKGYKLKRIDASKAPSYNEGNNTVTLTPGGQLLTYVFAPAGPTVTPTLQVGNVMTEPGIKSTDNTISGIGKKGATIKIAAAGKTIVDNVTVAEDGSWSATLPSGVNSNITDQDQLVPRDTLTVTQTINGEESAETEVKVGLGESVVQPSETSSDKQSIVAETTTVTLKVPHDAGIAYFDYPKAGNARSVVAIKRDSIPGAWTSKDESKAVVKSYSTDGFFDTIVLEMKEQIQPGKAKVVSNIKEDKYTSPVGWKEINVEAKPADTTPPAAPKVNPVTAASTAVTGTAEPGSTVEVTLPNGSTVSAKADQDGNFSVPVSGLEEGKTVSVTATDAAGNKSGATSVTVPDTTAPAAPTVNPVKAGATAITGTAEAGSTVEVTLPDGQKASAKAGENGEFSIPVPALNADDKISVTATDVAKNTSTPTKVTVKETVRPVLNIPYDDADTQAIYVYSGETNNIELKVTDNSGKIVKAYLAMPADNRTGLGQEDNTYLNGKARSGLYLNAEKIKTETTTTETSPAVIRVTGDIPKNTYTDGAAITRYLFAEDAAGNTSYEHVGANMDKGALGRIRFIWKPQSFKYTAVAPSTPITSNTVPEASAIEKAVKDANPTFSDKIESVSVDGTNVKVTYKDGSTDVIPADSVFTIEPTAPTVTPVKNPSSLTQPEKDAVKKAVETANKTATKVEVGNDGTTTLTYSNGSTATLKPRQTVSQADITAPNAPVVNPVKAGDTAVTGTAEAGSTVEVTLPDGTKATATAD